MTGAVLTVPGFRLASNYNYASTAIGRILLFDALIMIYGKCYLYLFLILASRESEVPESSKESKRKRVLSIKY